MGGITISCADCLDQQGRFWRTARNGAIGPTVSSAGKRACVARGQVQSSSTMLFETASLFHFSPSLEQWKRGLGCRCPTCLCRADRCSLLDCVFCGVYCRSDPWPLLFPHLATHIKRFLFFMDSAGLGLNCSDAAAAHAGVSERLSISIRYLYLYRLEMERRIKENILYCGWPIEEIALIRLESIRGCSWFWPAPDPRLWDSRSRLM